MLTALTLSTRAATLVVDTLDVTNTAVFERSLTVLASPSVFTNIATNTLITGSITNGLVGYWPFDSNMDDYSGFNNHGTNFGATQTVGRIGGAYRFNGTGNYAKLPYSTNFVLSGDFTISFWASNVASGGSTCGILGSGYGYTNGWLFSASINQQRRMSFWFSQSSVARSIYSDGAIDDNWHNTAVIRSGSAVSMFIDGTLQARTTNYAGAINVGGYYTYIGGYQAEGSFNPITIDEIAIWQRALSVDELKTIANAPPINTNVLLRADGTNVEVLGTMKIQQLVPQGDIGMGSFTNRP